MELDNLHVKGRLDRLAEQINLAVLSCGQVKNCPTRLKLRFGSSRHQSSQIRHGKVLQAGLLGTSADRHPWPFIVFPLLLNVALSIGLLYMNEITDATYLYTPTNARSKYEREVIHQKWPLLDGNYVAGHTITSLRECQSIVSARDGGNILRNILGVFSSKSFTGSQFEMHIPSVLLNFLVKMSSKLRHTKSYTEHSENAQINAIILNICFFLI
ncbi:conserved hypothetical protein [Trichinella spiralis]|uniref:hypothetical protein n=1 Tax=Trichinella spiralis TaxID=6334 RepID=UPI0001EFC5F0|nr:conserved hypothetical protein [Trichinella spiralis]